jgi:hypothetical protein
MSYSVTLNIDAPPDPGYTLEVAEAFAECVRLLNHHTRHDEALEFPAEGDRLLRYLESAAERLPQLIDQVVSWYERRAAAGGLLVVAGDYKGDPDRAVMMLRMRADAARLSAEHSGEFLRSVAAVTTNLAAAGGDDD